MLRVVARSSGKRLACLLCTLGTALLLPACTGGGIDRGVPDAGGRTYARLGITLTLAREGHVTIGTSARLLRYRGIDVESAQVLAGSLATARDLAPRERPAGPEAGPGDVRCGLMDDEALLQDALATSPPDAVVSMLDAGELLVHVAGQTLKIAPSYVPDIVPFVSGVVYDAELLALEPLADVGPEGGEEAFVAAFGGPQIGRFMAPAEVPVAPRLLSVNGVDIEGGRAQVERDAEISLSWAPDPSERGPIQIVLASDFGPALRCLAPDTGRFVVPATLVTRLGEALRDEPLTLALERTRRTPFSAPGIETAEVEVTVRDVVILR
jgi:hypothetical protein